MAKMKKKWLIFLLNVVYFFKRIIFYAYVINFFMQR